MKKAYIFLIAVIIVAAVVWIIERPGDERLSNFKPFRLYPGMNINDVEKIEIENLINGVLLIRIGDTWEVSPLETEMAKNLKSAEKGGEEVNPPPTPAKANEERIKLAIEKLGNLEAGALASTNPEKQAIYQVNTLAQIVTISGRDGNILAKLYIGKLGPDMYSSYVRREGEDEVYLAAINNRTENSLYVIGEQISPFFAADASSWKSPEPKEEIKPENPE